MSLPAVGLGMASLGRPAYINLGHDLDYASGRSVDAMRARALEVLDAAWSLGVRHVDCARSYGRAEEFVGAWLAARPGRRTEVTLGSKWGYTYVADWQVEVETHEVKEHSVETLARQWPETLAALGSAPDVYVVHSVTPESPALNDRALLDALGDIASGGVRVGLSTSGPAQAEVLTTALRLGESSPFSAVQATWNLLEPSCGPALRSAYDAGWHVALKETVANGRLTARGSPPPAVVAVAREHGVTPDAVGMAAALRQPATVVLSGASTMDQLASNLTAYDVLLDDAELDTLAAVAESADAYWQTRGALPWT